MPTPITLETIEQISTLRERVAGWRRAGQRVAFVPTMGNLHAGHLALVAEARRLAERVVVSIFVNPLQFGPQEDFGAYPRTLARDQELLAGAGTDLLFAPSVEVVYPRGQAEQTRVEVPGISDILCGASRPGHFVGVATVVCKLFNMVQPDLAVFGEKDYQQLMVIRRMTLDLSLPVAIQGLATVREADGLAMSSRNGYLTAQERARAPALYLTLRRCAEWLRQGLDIAAVEGLGREEIAAAGFGPDYVSVRRAANLGLPQAGDRELVVLAAARLGRARLIDNLRVER
ncbi:MAG: pantoate--beta-alanine ligase [Chromatiaceae bacterium]|nr:pantoate--beta-alanine ligase [Candidatus Thioaporhodococcus sediminis]